MIIKTVNITNFLTTGDDTITVNLDSKGLVLIRGDNKDDTSAISNGAGKSTIGDAICWCLYGITAREESGDDIINNINLKGCQVTVEIEDDGVNYIVMRHRKHKEFKNSTRVVNLTTGADLTKGTDKLTQEVVNALVGCTVEVFTSSIYAGQDGIPNLPGMTDKNLKEIVETAAGVDRLLSAYEIAKENLKVEKNKAATLVKWVESAENSVEKLELKKAEMVKSNDDFDNQNKIQINLKQAELDGEVAKLENLKESPLRLTDDEIDALYASKATINSEIDKFFDEKDKLTAVEESFNKELNAIEANLRVKVATFKSLRSDIEAIEDRVGKPCGECGKDYCEEDLKGALEIAKVKISTLAKEIAVSRAELLQVRHKKSKASDNVNALGDPKVIAATNRTSIDEIDERLLKSSDIEKEIIRHEEIARNKFDDLNKQTVATNPYEALLNSLIAELKEENEDLVKQRNDLAASENTVKLAEEGVQVFGPAGVRAYIIDTITPLLNERTAHYLSILSDGNVSAVWNTLTKAKSGEIKEKFAIEVTNDKGAGKFGLLSGGEKRKVRIATTLALQDLVSSRAIKPISLFIADEIDDAVDEAGLERLMMLLDEKAREKGTVLMISHNEIGSWCSNQAVVTKEGGFSRLEGALS